MARLYADEDFPLPAVEALRHLGHDMVTVQEAGRAGQAIGDAQVLAEASADLRAVLTHNHPDFRRLHRAVNRTKASSPVLRTRATLRGWRNASMPPSRPHLI